MLTDVHAHLDLLDEIEQAAVIERAKQAGVKVIINNGVDTATSTKSLQLAEKHSIVSAAIGIYPTNAAALSPEEADSELGFLRDYHKSAVAFGEIGLDYEQTEDRARQHYVFEQQLKLAEELSMPVIVHSRKAEATVLETVQKFDVNAVMHAYHGSTKLALSAAQKGIYFSIPTNIARSEHMQHLATLLPITQLLTETDTPYLGIQKEKPSEPAHVKSTIATIARLRNTSENAVEAQLYDNFNRIFKNP